MAAINPQDALIHLMVSIAAADGGISDVELREFDAILTTLPVFRDFDRTRLPDVSRQCSEMLAREDGIDAIIENVRSGVPEKLHETAYALAIEVVASDLTASQTELRFLQMLRDRLELDSLATAAIERSARVRYRRL